MSGEVPVYKAIHKQSLWIRKSTFIAKEFIKTCSFALFMQRLY